MLIISEFKKSIRGAVNRFIEIDATQRAGAFAYYAFFALFPVMLLFVAIAAEWTERSWAEQMIVNGLRKYMPGNQSLDSFMLETLDGVLKAGGKAGFVAFLMLIWSGTQFFMTMVTAVDRAWGDLSQHNWWQMPAKSLALLALTGLAVLGGLTVSVVSGAFRGSSWPVHLSDWMVPLVRLLLPTLFLFLGLVLFYKLTPRRKVFFAEVWLAAFLATVALRTAENLFVLYLNNFASFNAIYGAFGSIIAFLLWIYLSGCIFIFGACLCVQQAGAISRLRP